MRPPIRIDNEQTIRKGVYIDIGEYVNHAIDNEETISNGVYWFEYDYENDLWNGERMTRLWDTGEDKHIVLTTDELIDYLFDTIL